MTRDINNLSTTVGFRLVPDQHEKLKSLAESAGVSIHVYARMLVTTSIGQLEISNGINAIRDEQLALRIAIARAIEAILINTTDLEETTIRRFTRDKLLQDIPQSKDAKGKP